MPFLAIVFFLASAACTALSTSIEASVGWDTAIKIAAVIFGFLFFCSVLIGKKIKFDPVLR